jgi:hypothetical protein
LEPYDDFYEVSMPFNLIYNAHKKAIFSLLSYFFLCVLHLISLTHFAYTLVDVDVEKWKKEKRRNEEEKIACAIIIKSLRRAHICNKYMCDDAKESDFWSNLAPELNRFTCTFIVTRCCHYSHYYCYFNFFLVRVKVEYMGNISLKGGDRTQIKFIDTFIYNLSSFIYKLKKIKVFRFGDVKRQAND